MKVNAEYLEGLKPRYLENGYTVPKWIIFCEEMLKVGFKVRVHRAKTTVSKYIYISKQKLNLKIRFSNHRANKNAEYSNDSDYYVGIGNRGVITTEQLIKIIKERINYGNSGINFTGTIGSGDPSNDSRPPKYSSN